MPPKPNRSSGIQNRKPQAFSELPNLSPKPVKQMESIQRTTANQILNSQNLSKLANPEHPVRKIMKSVDNNKDRASQITYKPYNYSDYQKMKKDVAKQPPKGLGSNVGDDKWNDAYEKIERQKEFSKKLNDQNRKFGLMNAEKSYG